MNSVQAIVRPYLDSRLGIWAAATLRSEAARLKTAAALVDGVPVEEAWRRLSGLGAYSRVTTWNRLSTLVGWARDNNLWPGLNTFQAFRQSNPLLFRAAYKRRPAEVEYSEVSARIERIVNPIVRDAARVILRNGLRSAELGTLKDGRVIGKGGKEREVLWPAVLEHDVTYSQLWTALRLVGLKPHDLRKAMASELVAKGCDEHDLLKIMGWTSYETARCYVAPKKLEKVREMMKHAA